jgi:lipopolysaccharide transport system ATP-binding protein
MEPVVKVQNVSKQYQIGGLDAGYRTFRETFAGALAWPIRRLQKFGRRSSETIWALKDIDFVVQEGEILGLIGHNGAGKSTLLKILSRITTPTSGRTEVHGRIGSLLEVGTGFHPDLTGRENIYLNGAILGIRRAQIARRFDEIVAFSEIEQFIDTPVKWYSSGMYLRLAFSVAVHLDTEVLIMDEVLAVGDTAFQEKCLDKMTEIRNQGRTILFVSHNLAAVTRLCRRAIVLDKGHIIADGPSEKVVSEYLGASRRVNSEHTWSVTERPGNDVVKLSATRVRSRDGRTAQSFSIQEPVAIEMSYEVLTPGCLLIPRVEVFNEEGNHLFTSHDVESVWHRQERPVGFYVSTIRIPENFLSEGNMVVHASIVTHKPVLMVHLHVPKALSFQVVETQGPNTARGEYVGPITGAIRPLLSWETSFTDKLDSDASLAEFAGVSRS